jgi:hypothetical protein
VKLNFILVFIISLISFNSYSQYYSSSNKNLIIKEASCSKSPPLPKLFGVIVNRGSTPSEGLLNIKIFDSDNDIIYQRTENYRVNGENGSTFSLQIDIGDCAKPYRYGLTLTECKLKQLYRDGCEKD